MPLLWNRKITVRTSGLEIENLRISLSIERHIDSSQNVGTVTIFNLSDEHESRIYRSPGTITIEAGYAETKALIFDGIVQRVQRVRQNLSRQTVIKVGDRLRQQGGNLAKCTSTTFDGPAAVKDIFRYLANQIPISVVNLDLIPRSLTISNFAFSGKIELALSLLLKRGGLSWYENDGVIRINWPRPKTQSAIPQKDIVGVVLTPETGLIDRPIDTDEGVEAISLLNPAITIGGVVRLRAESFGQSDYKVVSLKHSADNWKTGKFQTWMELREI